MVVKQDVKTWSSEKIQVLFSYVKPTNPNGFYYVCTKAGTTGLNEPVWNSTLNSIVYDNTVVWKCVKEISSEFDIITLLPEINQEQELYLKFKDMFTFVLSENETDLVNIVSKYKEPEKLDDIFLRENLNELGYGYLHEANALNNAENLAVIFSYLKVIHLLKGTRKGLRFVLDLLGYPFTETLWYEKTPKGQPFTADINLSITFDNFTPSVISNLIKFLRSYVYPVVKLTADIEPFIFHEANSYAVGVGDYTFDFDMLFSIPNLADMSRVIHEYREGVSIFVSDSTEYENNAVIIPSETDITTKLRHIYKTQSLPVQDITVNNNNASIVTSVVDKVVLNHEYLENTGSTISDSGNNNNNASIVTSVVDKVVLNHEYLENTGSTISDSSNNNNDSSIVTSVVDNLIFNHAYSNFGFNIVDDSGNKNNPANIISNASNYPRSSNIIAKYDLNGDVLDSSGNNNHATILGSPSFIGGGILDFGNNNVDGLSIPYQVLNNKGNFTVSFWVKFKDFNLSFPEFNCLISCANASNIYHFAFGFYKTTSQFLVSNYSSVFLNPLGKESRPEDLDFHNISLTRNSSGLVRIFVDGELSTMAQYPSGVLTIDSGGIVINQHQTTGVGTGFNQNQSGNISLGSLLFYDIDLEPNEIKKIYNIGF